MIPPIAFVACLAAVVLFIHHSSDSIQLAVFGLFIGIVGGFCLLLQVRRHMLGSASGRATHKALAFGLAWFPPLWVGFCTLRGTGSWLWAGVAFVGGFFLWGGFITRFRRRPDGCVGTGPLRRVHKSRRHPAPSQR